jgi:outer membrane protein OmpA-like peptidoglycan-associated protein/tetratricopeptide (TPR) repeat protein
MKRILFPVAFLFSLGVYAQTFAPSSAQIGLVKKGGKAFDSQNWFSAVKNYEKAIDLNSGTTSMDAATMAEVTLRTAQSYERMGNRKKAANWYEKAKSYNPQNKELMLTYAKSLQAANRDADAIKAFEEYAQKGGDVAKSKAYLEVLNKKLAGKLTAKGVEVKSLKLRGDLSCYAPTLYGNTLVFVSPKKKEPQKDKPSTCAAYRTDLFQAKQKMNGDFGIPEALCKKINTSAMEDGASLNKDFSVLYFSRQTAAKNKEGKKVSKWGIFKAELACINDAKALPFVNAESNFAHPSINNSGTVLYFASDMPGGQGGMDIYKVSFTDSSFGKIENLGPEVNSAGDELYPREEGGKLYFSSNGFPGFGGFDIYSVDLDASGKASRRSLLQDPINSNFNEFSYTAKANVGTYFSSNRNGEYDVFKLSGTVTQSTFEAKLVDDSTSTPIVDAKVELIGADKRGEIVFTSYDGKAVFEGFVPGYYTLVAEKKGYVRVQINVDGTKSNTAYVKMNIERSMRGTVVNAADKSPITNAEVQWLAEGGKDGLVTHSEPNGLYVFDKTGPATGLINAKAKGFKDFSANQKEILAKNGTIEMQLGEEGLVSAGLRPNGIDLTPIYFIYASSSLSYKNYTRLQKLAHYLQFNTAVKVTLTGLTDDQGKDDTNKSLAQKRAESVKKYLIQYGVPADRIVLKTTVKVPVDNKCKGDRNCIEKSRSEHRSVTLELR